MPFICSNASVLDKLVVGGSQSRQAICPTVSASMALASPYRFKSVIYVLSFDNIISHNIFV